MTPSVEQHQDVEGCMGGPGFDPRLNKCSVNSLLLAGQMNGFPQGAEPSNRPDSPFIALGKELSFETDCSLVLALKLFKSIGCTVQLYGTAK